MKQRKANHRVLGVAQGRLRYVSGEEILLFARTAFGSLKICRVLFGKDGSIYVPFPYLKEKRGLLAAIRDDPLQKGPVTYDFARNGIVVDYDVKYAHHTSGVAHFSRTGKDERLPGRRSFPLDSEGGIVFLVHAYFLSGLDHVDAKSKRGELRVGMDFKDRHPFGIHVVAEWVSKQTILERTERGMWPVGPIAEATDRDGNRKTMIFIGQGAKSPLQNHLLVVSAGEIAVPQGVSGPAMTFFGGLTLPDSEEPGFIAFMFPYRGGPDGPPNSGLHLTGFARS